MLGSDDDDTFVQNTQINNGPLFTYPIPKKETKLNEEYLKDITSSLPSKLGNSMNSIIDRHELFYVDREKSKEEYVVDKWISLFASIFGKDHFTLNNEKLARDTKEKLELYPHEEVDAWRNEVYEEIERLQRRTMHDQNL